LINKSAAILGGACRKITAGLYPTSLFDHP